MPAGSGGRNTNRPSANAGGGGGSDDPGSFGAADLRQEEARKEGVQYGPGGATLGNDALDTAANIFNDVAIPVLNPFPEFGKDPYGEDALAREMRLWGDVYGAERANVQANQSAWMGNMSNIMDPYREGLGTVWGDKAPNLDFSGMFENEFRNVSDQDILNMRRAIAGAEQQRGDHAPEKPPELGSRSGGGLVDDGAEFVPTHKAPRSLRGGRGSGDAGEHDDVVTDAVLSGTQSALTSNTPSVEPKVPRSVRGGRGGSAPSGPELGSVQSALTAPPSEPAFTPDPEPAPPMELVATPAIETPRAPLAAPPPEPEPAAAAYRYTPNYTPDYGALMAAKYASPAYAQSIAGKYMRNYRPSPSTSAVTRAPASAAASNSAVARYMKGK